MKKGNGENKDIHSKYQRKPGSGRVIGKTNEHEDFQKHYLNNRPQALPHGAHQWGEGRVAQRLLKLCLSTWAGSVLQTCTEVICELCTDTKLGCAPGNSHTLEDAVTCCRYVLCHILGNLETRMGHQVSFYCSLRLMNLVYEKFIQLNLQVRVWPEFA